ncbi:MAG: response regulator [bacterium]
MEGGKETNEEEKKSIMIVDDEPDILLYLETLLADQGYRVIKARSAEEAWEKLREDKPDLFCLDIMMPKQSGIALYRNLKLDPLYKDVPTIFISAFSTSKDFTGKGFRKLVPDREVPEPEVYLEKPLNIPSFLSAVRQNLE